MTESSDGMKGDRWMGRNSSRTGRPGADPRALKCWAANQARPASTGGGLRNQAVTSCVRRELWLAAGALPGDWPRRRDGHPISRCLEGICRLTFASASEALGRVFPGFRQGGSVRRLYAGRLILLPERKAWRLHLPLSVTIDL